MHPYRSNGTIVCTSCPASIEFGIDLHSWSTGASFRGVKLVPPGTHVVSTATREGAPRAAFFLHLHEGAIAASAWHVENEYLQHPSSGGVDDALLVGIKTAISSLQLDPFLGAFPMEHSLVWSRLTNCITPAVLDRLQPIGGILLANNDSEELGEGSTADGVRLPPLRMSTSAAEDVDVDEPAMSVDEAPADATSAGAGASTGLAAGTASTSGTSAASDRKDESAGVGSGAPARRGARCYFSRIPGVGATATAAQRTAYGVDTSAALRSVWRQCMGAARSQATSASSDFSALGAQAQLLPDGRVVDLTESSTLGAKSSPSATQCSVCAAAAADDSLHSNALRHFIGELQFAFTSFLCGQSYSAFEQWKHLVDIVCRSEAAQLAVCGRTAPIPEECADKAAALSRDVAVEVPSSLFSSALAALREQLPHLPRDFFIDELSRKNFLGFSLSALVRTAAVHVALLQPSFVQEVARLSDAAAAAFPGWFVPGISRLAVSMVAEGLPGAPRSAEAEEAAAEATASSGPAVAFPAGAASGASGGVGASAATHASHVSAASASSHATAPFATADLLAALEAVAAADSVSAARRAASKPALGRSAEGRTAGATGMAVDGRATTAAAAASAGAAHDASDLAAARTAALAAIDALPTVSDYSSFGSGPSTAAHAVPPVAASPGATPRLHATAAAAGARASTGAGSGARVLSCLEELDGDGDGDEGHDEGLGEGSRHRDGLRPAAARVTSSQSKQMLHKASSPGGDPAASNGASRSFADVSHLLAALRDEGGDDDLPAFVPMTELGEFAPAVPASAGASEHHHDAARSAAAGLGRAMEAPESSAGGAGSGSVVASGSSTSVGVRTRGTRIVVVDDDE